MDIDRFADQEDASRPSIEPPSSPPPFLAPYPILARKRTRAPEPTDDSTPSDGPFFSSDPPDPSVDEYFQPRRKRQYRGTWWGEITREDAPAGEPASQRTKNGFTRNMDSGIWMGSDVTDEDFASDHAAADVLFPQDVGRHAVPQNATRTERIRPRATFDSVSASSRLDNSKATTGRQMVQEKDEARTIKFARSRIQDFLDNSDENIALFRIGLKKLPEDFFAPLQTLFRDPSPFDPDNAEGETEVEFHARGLIPRIKLDVSNNALQDLPLGMFDLQNITKLNLSHNNLNHLSRHIGKLKNLGSLDVRGNRLRWLPWELIQLSQSGKLKAIDLDYNPFLQPFSFVSCFGSWEQPWIPPSHIELALEKLWCEFKNWRRFRKAKLIAPSPQEYDQAIEHAKWMTHFHLSCIMSWKAEPPHTIHAASSQVVRFGVDGRLLHGQPMHAPSSLPVDEFVYPATFRNDHVTWIMERLERESVFDESFDSQAFTGLLAETTSPHRDCAALPVESVVPSLFELALQSATRGSIGHESKYEVKDLLSAVREDDPETLRQGIQTAIDVHEEGGRVCSVCSRPFIIARTEWIEYWYLGKSSSVDNTKAFIPILRRGCSPNCFVN